MLVFVSLLEAVGDWLFAGGGLVVFWLAGGAGWLPELPFWLSSRPIIKNAAAAMTTTAIRPATYFSILTS
jgi:hypothetical protein